MHWITPKRGGLFCLCTTQTLMEIVHVEIKTVLARPSTPELEMVQKMLQPIQWHYANGSKNGPKPILLSLQDQNQELLLLILTLGMKEISLGRSLHQILKDQQLYHLLLVVVGFTSILRLPILKSKTEPMSYLEWI